VPSLSHISNEVIDRSEKLLISEIENFIDEIDTEELYLRSTMGDKYIAYSLSKSEPFDNIKFLTVSILFIFSINVLMEIKKHEKKGKDVFLFLGHRRDNRKMFYKSFKFNMNIKIMGSRSLGNIILNFGCSKSKIKYELFNIRGFHHNCVYYCHPLFKNTIERINSTKLSVECEDEFLDEEIEIVKTLLIEESLKSSEFIDIDNTIPFYGKFEGFIKTAHEYITKVFNNYNLDKYKKKFLNIKKITYGKKSVYDFCEADWMKFNLAIEIMEDLDYGFFKEIIIKIIYNWNKSAVRGFLKDYRIINDYEFLKTAFNDIIAEKEKNTSWAYNKNYTSFISRDFLYLASLENLLKLSKDMPEYRSAFLEALKSVYKDNLPTIVSMSYEL
jgi:hypothetical protein